MRERGFTTHALELAKATGNPSLMLEETAKQQYLRAWEYYQQGKSADARALAYVLLKSEKFEAKWYAHVILSHAEESAVERMQNLKPLLARDPQSAWAGQRFIQLKSELLDEAARALQQHDYPLIKEALQPVLEIAPNDPAATALWELAQPHLIATHEPAKEFAPRASDTAPLETPEQNENVEASSSAAFGNGPTSSPTSTETERADSADEIQAQSPASVEEQRTAADTAFTSVAEEQLERGAAAQHAFAWRFPFADEAEIVAAFEACLHELLARSEMLSPKPESLQRSLLFAIRKKRETWKEDITTNLFLKPAVLAATDLAEAFLREGYWREAFATANVFCEMCKPLLARSTEQYRRTFERLLRTASRACTENALEEWQRNAVLQTLPEAQYLAAQLHDFCLAPAVSKFFDNKTAQFIREERETELREGLRDEVLAEIFLEHQQRFSENEAEEREAFVRRNLPFLKTLRLSPELQTKVAPWLGASSQEEPANPLQAADLHAAETAHGTLEKNIWRAHPVTSWLSPEELREIVDEFLEAGHVRDLIAWLKERIECQPNFFANCLELARIYEDHTREIDKAFEIFYERLAAQLSGAKDAPWVEKTAKKMLQLCKRHQRVDLARQLHAAVEQFSGDADFLQELTRFIEPFAEAVNTRTLKNDEAHQEERAAAPGITSARAFETSPLRGRAGLFIDHENLWNGILDVNRRHQIQLPHVWWEKEKWLDEVLRVLLVKAKDKFQRVAARVAVGYWQHRDQASFLPAYLKHKFIPMQPEIVAEYEGAIKNGVDFKLADEIRRTQKLALLAGAPLQQIIIVSGDGDFAHLAGNLVEEEILVQIWSVTKTVNKVYRDIIGSENVVFIDEECLYRQQP